jgi:hypothetical protein
LELQFLLLKKTSTIPLEVSTGFDVLRVKEEWILGESRESGLGAVTILFKALYCYFMFKISN